MGRRISIWKLREHLGRYLRSRAVDAPPPPAPDAVPATQAHSILDRLIAEGRARPPEADLAEFLAQPLPPASEHGERALSDEVIRAREDERY